MRQCHYFWSLREQWFKVLYFWPLVWGSFRHRQKEAVIIFDHSFQAHFWRGSRPVNNLIIIFDRYFRAHFFQRQWFSVHYFWSSVWGSDILFDGFFRANISENQHKTWSLFLVRPFRHICRKQLFIVKFFWSLVWVSVMIFDRCFRVYFSGEGRHRRKYLVIIFDRLFRAHFRSGHYLWSLISHYFRSFNLGTFFGEQWFKVYYFWSLVWGSSRHRQKEVVIIFDHLFLPHIWRGSSPMKNVEIIFDAFGHMFIGGNGSFFSVSHKY